MSSQDSWSCLTVQKFFSLCNWQGQLQVGETESFSCAPSLLGQTSWQCLSVEELFSLCNWQGQFKVGEQDKWAEEKESFWQCLSVTEFFSLCNWQGQPLENRNWQHANPFSCLILPVRKFFQYIPWEGNPEIGSLPEISPILEPTPANPVEITLTDLSELF